MTAVKPDTIGWKFWQAARKGEKFDRDVTMVPIGYYRKIQNRSTGKYVPLAIWVGKDGVKLVANAKAPPFRLETAEAEEDFSFNTFAHIRLSDAISHEDYKHWMEHEAWPAERNPDPLPEIERNVGPGDNSGLSAEDALAQFSDQVDSAVALSETIKAVNGKEQADLLQGYRTRLTTLAGEGAKLHQAEKEPHLVAGRAVDAAWFPIIRKAEAAAKTAKAKNDAFATAEMRRRKEQEAAQKAAGFASAAAEPAPASDAPQEPAKPKDLVFKGASGRAAKAKTILVGTIVDQDAFYGAVKNTPEVKETLERIKDRFYKNLAPGMPDAVGCTSVERVVT